MRRADRCGACSDMCSGAVRCRGLSPLRKQPHSPGSAPGRRQMQGLPASHARCALARGRRDVHSYKGVVSTSQGNPWFPCPARRGRKAAGRGNGTGRLRRGTRVGLRSARGAARFGTSAAAWGSRTPAAWPPRSYGVERRADESPLERLVPRNRVPAAEAASRYGGGTIDRAAEGDHPDSAAWLRRARIPWQQMAPGGPS